MEYIFYIISYYKNHEPNKKCYHHESQPYDLDVFVNTTNIETYFENKKCCLKCALYAQLWYNQMILEKNNLNIILNHIYLNFLLKI